jgi:cytochrome c-type biogenesis protein CcmH
MYAVAKQLNCPTCEGRNLADCPTDTCTQWKQEIAAQLKAGKTNDEVLAYFKERFGDQVLQEPPKEGFTLLVWVVPIAAALALVAMAVVVTRRAARSAKPVVVGAKIVPTTAAATDDYETQLEEQVKQVS